MSRLIDADKAKEVLTKLLYETALNNSGGASSMCEDIAENRLETWFGLVPTVDAVEVVAKNETTTEVVRCKDCKWRGKRWRCKCKNPDMWYVKTKDEDFCSWGERREDDNK